MNSGISFIERTVLCSSRESLTLKLAARLPTPHAFHVLPNFVYRPMSTPGVPSAVASLCLSQDLAIIGLLSLPTLGTDWLNYCLAHSTSAMLHFVSV